MLSMRNRYGQRARRDARTVTSGPTTSFLRSSITALTRALKVLQSGAKAESDFSYFHFLLSLILGCTHLVANVLREACTSLVLGFALGNRLCLTRRDNDQVLGLGRNAGVLVKRENAQQLRIGLAAHHALVLAALHDALNRGG